MSPTSQPADRCAAILTALPAAVIVLDEAGRICDHNPAATRLFGNDLDGRLWREAINDWFAPQPARGPDLQLRDGRLVKLTTCPMGSTPGQLLLMEDVTEQRRIESHLVRQERLVELGRMAATLAHQIRTPLSAALLYVSQLASSALSEEKRQRFAERARESLRALERLIADMLAYARADAMGGEEWVEPAAPLLGAQRTLAGLLEESATHCIVESLPVNQRLRGNAVLLQSAIQNLMVNAVQAMGRGGELQLMLRAGPPGSIDMVVADRGPGVPADLRAQLFEPFVSRRPGGTGLGLAVVRSVTRAHGGEVWYEENPGGGSRFILRLPAHPIEQAAAAVG